MLTKIINQVKHTLTRIIESPWSPDTASFPPRRSPEDSGNSTLPYRTLNRKTAIQAKEEIAERLRLVTESQENIRISNWSDLYKFNIPISNLPINLQGRKILHLSDIHFLKNDPRPLLEVQHLITYLKKNNIRPDVIVFTGDLITKLPDDLCQTALRLLKELSTYSPHNFFVLGNHDYHGNVPHYIIQKIEQAGFSNLTNSTARVRFKDSCINFIGVDDAYFGRPTPPQFIVSTEVNIALTHNLDAIRSNFPGALDLILSGHTHWGEFKEISQNIIRYLDGMWWMGRWGYYDNINKQAKGWDILTARTLSFIHPALARYYAPRRLAYTPGFVLHELVNFPGHSQAINIDLGNEFISRKPLLAA